MLNVIVIWMLRMVKEKVVRINFNNTKVYYLKFDWLKK